MLGLIQYSNALVRNVSRNPSPSVSNLLLDSFSSSARATILCDARVTSLKRGTSLFEAGQVVKNVVFPSHGTMISLVILDEDGTAVEAGVVGDEGLAGLSAVFGMLPSSHVGVVQVAGDLLTVAADLVVRLFENDKQVQKTITGYAIYLLAQISQTALCNRLHNADERLARWLLMCRDRAGKDDLALTHELLAQMLGTRRSTVSLSAGTLQAAGLISYVHGRVTILDSNGLLEAACSCYKGLARLRSEYLPQFGQNVR